MFRLASCLIIVGFVAFSCKEKQPEGIMDKDVMAAMLVEFYLREARVKTATINEDSATLIFAHLRNVFSKKSGIPDSIIDKSYNYYLARPKELQDVYIRVIDTLALREQRAYSSTYQ